MKICILFGLVDRTNFDVVMISLFDKDVQNQFLYRMLIQCLICTFIQHPTDGIQLSKKIKFKNGREM
jgi:hypothetical protein